MVTYKSVEECDKVLAMESKKFKEDDEEELEIKFQKDWFAEKGRKGKKDHINGDDGDKKGDEKREDNKVCT